MSKIKRKTITGDEAYIMGEDAKKSTLRRLKKEKTEGKSLGTESFTVIKGKGGKQDKTIHRKTSGLKDEIAKVRKKKLKKGTNTEELMKDKKSLYGGWLKD